MKRFYLKIPEGRKVHPLFSNCAMKTIDYMYEVLIGSYHAAKVDPNTNTRRVKLPMQINHN